jgi:Ca2+-transporting ATPase
VAAWQTMILTAVIFGQVMQAHVWRSSRDSVFRMNPFSNKPLLIASLVIVALQLVVVYAPAMHGIFETVALSAQEMAITLIVPLVVLIAGEIEKAIRRNRR